MMRPLIALAVIIGLGLSAYADELLSLRKFRDLIMERFAEAYPGIEFVAVDDDVIDYQDPDPASDIEGHIYANYSYDLYRSDPEGLDGILERLVQNMGPLSLGENDPEDLTNEEFLKRLVLVLRPSDYISGLNIDDNELQLVSRPFIADLDAVVALDSPQALSFVTRDVLEDRELSTDKVLETAMMNIREHIGEVIIEVYEGMKLVATENGLASSLPLMPEACTIETADYAFWLADRETLIRRNLDEGEPGQAFYELSVVAANALADGYGMSKAVIMCTNGEWAYIYPSISEH